MHENTRIVGSLFLLGILILLFTGCTQPSDLREDGRLLVVVTIPPQEEMVRAVSGNRADVLVMIPPGSDPHTYEPTPQQVALASRATLYLTIGKGLFPIEDSVSSRLQTLNPDLVVVDGSSGIKYLGEGATPDPHVWLSLRNWKHMVENTKDALTGVDRSNESSYRSGSDAYAAQIDQLDRTIDGYFTGKVNRTIIVSHPAWAYFARDYDLFVITIEEEGKEPTPRELAGIVDQARENGLTRVFTDGLENPRNAEVIAREIDGTVEAVNPLAADYLANMDRTAQAFARSLPA